LSNNLPLDDSDFISLCTLKFTSFNELLEIAADYDSQCFVIFYEDEYLIAFEDDFYINPETEEAKQKVREYIAILNERYL